eukprot:SAG31_NODE_725_length_12546_cov_34.366857_3_plen_46_part_00
MLVVISKVLLSILVLVPILYQFYLHGAAVPLNLAGLRYPGTKFSI